MPTEAEKRPLEEEEAEVFVTHVKPGTDPYQRYDEDNPAEMVELEVSTDEETEDADDLSEVSLMSQGMLPRLN